MKILFSPSEKKCLSHPKEIPSQQDFYTHLIAFGMDGFLDILRQYVDFLQTADEKEIAKLFGSKAISMDVLSCCGRLFSSPLLLAILRYSGVAYKALDYEHLPPKAQTYLLNRLFIFSNFFGVLRASDCIPYYELKQGQGFGSFQTKLLYHAQKEMLLGLFGGEILDLRAGFYQRCLALESQCVYEPIFLQRGKIVSHYAKFYRGKLLACCACEQIEQLAHLCDMAIDGLVLKQTRPNPKKGKHWVELLYEVR